MISRIKSLFFEYYGVQLPTSNYNSAMEVSNHFASLMGYFKSVNLFEIKGKSVKAFLWVPDSWTDAILDDSQGKTLTFSRSKSIFVQVLKGSLKVPQRFSITTGKKWGVFWAKNPCLYLLGFLFGIHSFQISPLPIPLPLIAKIGQTIPSIDETE